MQPGDCRAQAFPAALHKAGQFGGKRMRFIIGGENMLGERKGQSTVEYALIIGVIVGSLVAMQTYVKRGLQARYHDGVQFLSTQTNELGSTNQYEPHYVTSSYDATQRRNVSENVADRGQITRTLSQEQRERAAGGFEQYENTGAAD